MPAAMTRVGYRGLGYLFCESLTYRKAWKQFEAAFARLPTDRALILDYLGNFDGPSGRYSLNNQDSIHYLYKHAVSLGWLESDRMHGMKRPNIQEQMPNTMTLEQVGNGPRPTCWPGTAGGRTNCWRSLPGRSGRSLVIIFLLCYILAQTDTRSLTHLLLKRYRFTACC